MPKLIHVASDQQPSLHVENCSGQRSPGGTRTVDISINCNMSSQKKEGDMVEHFLESKAEEPLSIPLFEHEDSDEESIGNDSLESGENNKEYKIPPNADFKWEGIETIQQKTNENAELHAIIKEQKNEMEEMQVLLEALEPIPGINAEALIDVMHGTEMVDQDIRDVKIVNQAKKIRNLKVIANREKGRVASLKAELNSKQQEINRLTANNAKSQFPQSKLDSASHQLSKKVEEMRHKLEEAKSELKRTQRALTKEVGDNVSISKILNESSGWRGRHETILMLKSKLKRLKDSSVPQKPSDTDDLDTKAREGLKAMRNQRVQQTSLLTKENNHLKEELEEMAKKYEASKSRIKTLDKEVSKVKKNIKVLLDKSNNDDLLVDALQEELEEMRSDYSNLKQAHAGSLDRPQYYDDSGEIERLKSLQSDQKRQISHQEKVIQSLQQKLKKAGSGDTNSSDNSTERLLQEIKGLKEKIKTLQDETNIKELESENEFLSSELQKLKQRYNKLLDKLKHAE